ncbi:MAG: YidC/Oxa1 family membrane protein insertase [Clostridiales bacterium]|nr:YidC/Oxa1 family membrane protein insertase [Clostridiales bacterium]
MTVLNYLFFLLVVPLRLLFEVIFFYAYKFTSNCGLSIIAMSLVVNFLLLPLYFRADKLEKEQNDKKKMMESGVTRIKNNFKGDERIMILQTYYRINDHKSTDVLKESVSLFLQIPFFIAAYSFLSGLQMLHGISLGPIADLGLPDGLIPLGSLHINLLPILMTLINIASGFIYSEKGHFKDKIKLILIALVFLVLLYGSPSGLVFYWTLNNLFSLVKNIVVHYRKPRTKIPKTIDTSKISTPVIMLSLAIIAVLTGLLIPADVISENPQEMVNSYSAAPHSPALYLVTSMLIAAGTFLIWIPLFSFLTKEKTGKVLTLAAPAVAISAIANYILFNKNFGLLSSSLKYEVDITYSMKEIALNALANIAIAAAVIYLAYKFRRVVKMVLAISLVAVCVLSITNTYLIVW